MAAWRPAAALAPVVCLCLATACVSPAERIDRIAHEQGFERQVVTGTSWQHVVYANARTGQAQRLHIYLEGDGSPWIGNREIARDPTPRQPLMLSLMALDAAPAVYLGRPCYFGRYRDPGCAPWLWTSGRYSEEVATSMHAALETMLQTRPRIRHLHWFGHSGGGTLALLLAERFPQSRSVVTVAGNLDPDAWTRYHGYSPLRSSLNPVRLDASEKVREIHLIGERDKIIPPQLSRAALAHRPWAIELRYPDFDHHCCWEDVWPEVLSRVLPEGRPD